MAQLSEVRPLPQVVEDHTLLLPAALLLALQLAVVLALKYTQAEDMVHLDSSPSSLSCSGLFTTLPIHT